MGICSMLNWFRGVDALVLTFSFYVLLYFSTSHVSSSVTFAKLIRLQFSPLFNLLHFYSIATFTFLHLHFLQFSSFFRFVHQGIFNKQLCQFSAVVKWKLQLKR